MNTCQWICVITGVVLFFLGVACMVKWETECNWVDAFKFVGMLILCFLVLAGIMGLFLWWFTYAGQHCPSGGGM